MSRIEYMRKLASLLQDVPVEERVAAMQYYNDFFDDAGEDNEESVIEELGAPEDVAAALKAGLDKQAAGMGEYGETGYTHPDLEQKSVPTPSVFNTDRTFKDSETRQRSSKWILWLILAICAAPIVIPAICGAAALVAGLAAGAVGILIGLIAASFGVFFGGAVIIIRGVILIMTNLPSGMALTGAGIMMMVLGLAAISASIQLVVYLIPKIVGLIRLLIDAVGRSIRKRRAV